jgi:hypothetical protein
MNWISSCDNVVIGKRVFGKKVTAMLLEEFLGVEYFKRLPPHVRMNLILVVNFALLGLFIYFTVSSTYYFRQVSSSFALSDRLPCAGYFSGIEQDYVAVDKSGGECDTVPKAVTGTYLLSDDGYWEGSQSFLYSHSLIALELNNLKVTLGEFQYQMGLLKFALYEWVSVVALNQSLAWNMLLLMEQRNTLYIDGYAQTVYYTAAPSVVFNAETMYAALASRDSGPCPVYSFPTFSSGDAWVSAKFDEQQLREQCNETIQFSSSDTAYSLDYYISDFTFDMNSYSAAAAINMGYADVSVLEQLLNPEFVLEFTSFKYNVTIDNVVHEKQYSVLEMVTPAHPGMNPLYCLYDDSANVLLACFLRRAYTFFLPILNHIGDTNASFHAIPDFCSW